MKVISSLGGPYIVLDRRYAHTWSGVFGKRFISPDSPFDNDYEAACEATGGRSAAPNSIGEITSTDCTALLIASPAETAVIAPSRTTVLLVQAEAADADWSYDELTQDIIEGLQFDPERRLCLLEGEVEYVVFDSSREFLDVGNDFLSFTLGTGKYSLAQVLYNQGARAELNLFRLQCDSVQAS